MEIQQHTDLEEYKKAFDAAMVIFEASTLSPCLRRSLSPGLHL
jgi:hypothetical protein